MDNAAYINIAKQSGLLRELNIIANNMANAGTVGFKRESVVFAEHIKAASGGVSSNDTYHSISMGHLGGHVTHFDGGEMRLTRGDLDVALEGEGFFRVEAPGGERLTRAGNFLTNQDGIVVTHSGYPVLDEAGGQIQIPQDTKLLVVSLDGTLSADGAELGRFGVVTALPTDLKRTGDNLWEATQGSVPVENVRILQGFLEGSNVQPVAEIARMIEVQRQYDAGQKIMDMEDERVKSVVSTLKRLT